MRYRDDLWGWIMWELGERVSWRLQTEPRDERWFAGLWI